MMKASEPLGPLVPYEMMITWWELMQIPPILMTAWWRQLAQMMMPILPAHHRHIALHEAHEQLVVPDPIEKDGEHALFA